MKPSSFQYLAPTTIAEAVQARAESFDSVMLAGGQSLIPTMNFRLANPETVIDLRRISELQGISIDGGWIHIGAMTRQRSLEKDVQVLSVNPLINAVLQHVAHPVIRNRGTVGGTIAHADPSAELPTLSVTLRGHMIVQGPGGRRTIPAEDFFEFIFTTALEPDEILVELVLPVLDEDEGWAVNEFSRRHGDYGVAAVMATLRCAADGTIASARVGACGISTVPVVLREVEEFVIGQQPSPELFEEAGQRSKEAVTAVEDPTTPPEYRRHVLSGLVRQTLQEALERSQTHHE